MYNSPYYSRKGRTNRKKLVNPGNVIDVKQVPSYYEFMQRNGYISQPELNGMFKTYQVDQEYRLTTGTYTSPGTIISDLIDYFELPYSSAELNYVRLNFTAPPQSSASIYITIRMPLTNSSSYIFFISASSQTVSLIFVKNPDTNNWNVLGYSSKANDNAMNTSSSTSFDNTLLDSAAGTLKSVTIGKTE
uniref:Cap n=1 Tax=Circular ssDNA virus sp. TaxID=2805939 RepID=A0A894JMG7_9VIRU|nr:hypothetical protein [Circular ssDNA virus sp.]